MKDLHVHVDNDAVCDKRLLAAKELAERLGAHLTGVYARRVFPFPVYGAMPTSADVVDIYYTIQDNQESAAHRTFDQHIGQDDPKVSWRVITGSVTGVIANEARYSDLLILGQPDPDDKVSLNKGLADQIIFSAGRPCLMIPHTGAASGFGKDPLIAWDGSREAARAVHDALSLLQLAGKVTVLTVQPEKISEDLGDLPGAMIAEHLARHDIAVEVKVLNGKVPDTSEAIMSYVHENGHDLIVMGAYGHSRLREIVLGGVTRHIMAHMEVPVLMSH